MARYVAALMTVIGNDCASHIHPALLAPLLGDAAPHDVLTAEWWRATSELKQQTVQRGEPSP